MVNRALSIGQSEPRRPVVPQDDTLLPFVVEVRVEVRADDEEAALAQVDRLMQEAWDVDSVAYDYEERPWHFEILEDAARRVERPERG